MDPLATLGLGAFATPQEVAAAYRTLAKRWHPDRAGSGPEAARRMAEINAAYDLLREGRPGGGPDLRGDRTRQEAARSRDIWGEESVPAPTGTRDAQAARRPAGHWLPDAVRRSLGRELLLALEPQEPVELVTPAAMWRSPRALLVATDRRLLWLLDDAISHRVHSLRWRDVGRVEHRGPHRLRRTATVRVETTLGRKLEWAQLPPDTALDIATWITARAGLAAGKDAAPAPG